MFTKVLIAIIIIVVGALIFGDMVVGIVEFLAVIFVGAAFILLLIDRGD